MRQPIVSSTPGRGVRILTQKGNGEKREKQSSPKPGKANPLNQEERKAGGGTHGFEEKAKQTRGNTPKKMGKQGKKKSRGLVPSMIKLGVEGVSAFPWRLQGGSSKTGQGDKEDQPPTQKDSEAANRARIPANYVRGRR